MPVVSINQHRINVTETGDGQDVILAVHSSGKSHRQWQGLGERAAESYRLVAADVFGHGRTDAWSGDADMSLASEVAVLQSLVANLPGRRVHLVGHSYGGAVAIKAMETLPVASLTLVEPAAFWMLDPESDREVRAEIWQVARVLAHAIEIGEPENGMRVFVDYWNGYGTFEALPTSQRARLIGQATTIAMQFRALFGENMNFLARRRIAAPTLLIHGDRARKPILRIIDRLFREIATCDVRVIAGAGHMSPCTHEAEVSSMILRHLASTGMAQNDIRAVRS